MQLDNFNRVEALRKIVFSYNYAQANISGHRMAAAVFAMRKAKSKSKKKLETESSDLFKVFGGCN